MGLETGTHVDDLVITNPIGGDGRHQGDDHLRLVKKVLQNSLDGTLGLKDAITELTISSGTITPDGSTVIRVDTEADAATDDLDTIAHTNMYDGGLLLVRAENSARDVVLKDEASGTDDLVLIGSKDVTLTDTDQWVLFVADVTNSKTYEVLRSTNLPQEGVPRITFTEQTALPATPVAARSALIGTEIGATTGYYQIGADSYWRPGLDGGILKPSDAALPLDDEALEPWVGQYIYMTPTAARKLTLPTTLVGQGSTLWVVNQATTDPQTNYIEVFSQDDSEIRRVLPGQTVWFRANKDAPTAETDWDFPGGLIYASTATISADATLYTLPANFIRADGQGLRWFVRGTCDSNQLQLKLAGTLIGLILSPGNEDEVTLIGQLIKDGSIARVFGGSRGNSSAAGSTASTFVGDSGLAQPAISITWSNTNDFSFDETGAAVIQSIQIELIK